MPQRVKVYACVLREQAMELEVRRLPRAQIARRLGVSRTTVTRWLETPSEAETRKAAMARYRKRHPEKHRSAQSRSSKRRRLAKLGYSVQEGTWSLLPGVGTTMDQMQRREVWIVKDFVKLGLRSVTLPIYDCPLDGVSYALLHEGVRYRLGVDCFFYRGEAKAKAKELGMRRFTELRKGLADIRKRLAELDEEVSEETTR